MNTLTLYYVENPRNVVTDFDVMSRMPHFATGTN